jgi:isopentenyl-diphosphate delta-isomerase type 1
MFEIVDEHDRVIGQASRSECHGNPALIHRVAHVHVCNRQGALLLQKRSLRKDIQPGRWDTSVGGHLEVGESYLQAARREMREELGLEQHPLTFLYYSKIRNAVESENVASYLVHAEGPLPFCRDEIDEVRFWSAPEIEYCLDRGVLTPNFVEEWTLLKDWNRKFPVATVVPLAFCAGDTLLNLGGSLAD